MSFDSLVVWAIIVTFMVDTATIPASAAATSRTADDDAVTSEWIELILRSQSEDGGFGAAFGQPPNGESTALALLALRARSQHASRADRARDWLMQRQRENGSWTLLDGAEDGGWVTPWVMLALQTEDGVSREALQRAADWLARRKGRQLGFVVRTLFRWLPEEERTALDPDLVGWPWHGGSFSWVEPTSVAVLALKRMRGALADDFPEDRVEQGELLILDRQCDGGGWNYGNSAVLGEELAPYPDTTAIALLALQDQSAEITADGRKALEGMLASEEASGLALALGALCRSVYGNDPVGLQRRLVKRYRHTGFVGETRTLAFASLAFDGVDRFKVS